MYNVRGKIDKTNRAKFARGLLGSVCGEKMYFKCLIRSLTSFDVGSIAQKWLNLWKVGFRVISGVPGFHLFVLRGELRKSTSSRVCMVIHYCLLMVYIMYFYRPNEVGAR